MARRSRSSQRRSDQGRRPNTAAPQTPGEIKLTFSSGYHGTLRPLPFSTVLLLKKREAELYPEPEQPTITTQTELGEKTVPASLNTEQGLQYLTALERIAVQRAEFRLDFIIGHFLTIDEAEEQGCNAVTQAHTKDIAAIKVLDPSLSDSDWDIALRHCVIRSADDYKMLQQNALILTTPISDQEIKAAAEPFRSDLQRNPDPEA